MPFDTNTPLGYMLSMVIQVADVYCLAICGYPSICFLLGGCWLWKTIMIDITNDLSHLKGNDSEMPIDDRIEQKSRFCDIIRNVSNAKQLSITMSMSNNRVHFSPTIPFQICE